MDSFELAKSLAKEKFSKVITSDEAITEVKEDMTSDTQDMVRLLSSLIEEIEATSFYDQRAEATEDQAIKDLMIHNRDEEIEHCAMLIEELIKRSEVWNTNLKKFLFKEESTVEAEQ